MILPANNLASELQRTWTCDTAEENKNSGSKTTVEDKTSPRRRRGDDDLSDIGRDSLHPTDIRKYIKMSTRINIYMVQCVGQRAAMSQGSVTTMLVKNSLDLGKLILVRHLGRIIQKLDQEKTISSPASYIIEKPYQVLVHPPK